MHDAARSCGVGKPVDSAGNAEVQPAGKDVDGVSVSPHHWFGSQRKDRGYRHSWWGRESPVPRSVLVSSCGPTCFDGLTRSRRCVWSDVDRMFTSSPGGGGRNAGGKYADPRRRRTFRGGRHAPRPSGNSRPRDRSSAQSSGITFHGVAHPDGGAPPLTRRSAGSYRVGRCSRGPLC
jgi:hypothetical protein